MSGNHNNSYPSFIRRPNDDPDSFDAMRERMNRGREAFFADHPTQGRPWPPLFQVGKLIFTSCIDTPSSDISERG